MTSEKDRLADLEHTVTHQDQQIQDLSDMVNQQWKEIDRLKKHLNRTEHRLEELEGPGEDSGIAHERPPHY